MVFSARMYAFFVVVFSMSLNSGVVHAEDPAPAAIANAQAFLDQPSTGVFVLSYAHFGTALQSHKLQNVRYVVDENGYVLPGRFALVYRYTWLANGTGTTDVAFLCDRNGKVEGVDVLSTDAVLQQPFLVADATIQVLGNALIEVFKDQMTAADLRAVRLLVDSADSEGLLEFALIIRQAASR